MYIQTFAAKNFSDENTPLFLNHLLFSTFSGQRQHVAQTGHWKSREVHSNPVMHGSGQSTLLLLALIYVPMEEVCPAGKWENTCSPQSPLCWDVGGSTSLTTTKDSEGPEWKIQSSALTPSSPKMQSWTLTLSYFLLHQADLFFGG